MIIWNKLQMRMVKFIKASLRLQPSDWKVQLTYPFNGRIEEA